MMQRARTRTTRRIGHVNALRGDKAPAGIPFQSLCDGLGIEAAPLGRRLLHPAIRGRRVHRRVRVQAQAGPSLRIVETKSRNQPDAMDKPSDTASSPAALALPDAA